MDISRRAFMGRTLQGAVAAQLFSASVRASTAGHSRRPNVVLLSVDALRPDRLGCYGHRLPTSPAIDSLAAEGTLFAHFFAQRGMTWPSLASLLTSQYPCQHGVRNNGVRLDGTETTLAGALREAGYATGMFYSNPWMASQRWTGFDTIGVGDEALATTKAIAWMSERKSEPFFLWLHLYAPHYPFDPPEQYAQEFVDPAFDGDVDGSDYVLHGVTLKRQRLTKEELSHVLALYDGEVRQDDDMVGRVLGYLDSAGLRGNTLVVFTADHGEELYDHNCYFYHLASVYDSVLRLPLILRWPERVPVGLRVGTVVESIDLAPTVLDLLGIPAPEQFRGRTLAAAWRGEFCDEGSSFAEWENKIVTMRTSRYRYVFNPMNHHPRWANKRKVAGRKGDVFYPIAEEELYDLAADPRESRNIAEEHSDRVAYFRKQCLSWMKENGWEFGEDATYEVDQELREQLEAVGYVF